jgi:hypothetical protein
MTNLDYFNAPSITGDTPLAGDPPPISDKPWFVQILNAVVNALPKPGGLKPANPAPAPTTSKWDSSTVTILAILGGVIVLVWLMNR